MYDVNFEIIIDTDSYAGNFERELCAYITGHWDEETHGGDQAKEFDKEVGEPNPFENFITTALTQDDDVPIASYQCVEWEPVNKKTNSVGIFFEKEPTAELIELIKERSYKFTNKGRIFDHPVTLKIIGFRLLKRTVKIEATNV
ncbi:hypothetical protein LCGC14_2493370 [marine sediment metagenome]|uniref:Uncharacterized protein n=1 Tax=marine sediment metagenome TaxID=412755 RepID=A0A0F9DXT6_9ZZZZ